MSNELNNWNIPDPKFGETRVIEIGFNDVVIITVKHPGKDTIKATTIFRPLGVQSEFDPMMGGVSFRVEWHIEHSKIPYK